MVQNHFAWRVGEALEKENEEITLLRSLISSLLNVPLLASEEFEFYVTVYR